MATVVLVRHGRTAANATGVLAGWTPGVALDETGRAQAEAAAARLAPVPLAAVVASPLERTVETAQILVAGREPAVEIALDERVAEPRYGDWTGRPLKDLAKDPLWKVVQAHPSAAVFPGDDGEGLAAMAARAVTAVRDWDARSEAAHGADAVTVVVSHGDVIKAITADALGLHLDGFQRLQVDPCSLTVIRYTPTRPFVVRTNDVGGAIDALLPPRKPASRRRRRSGDAVVGGGAGD